MEHIMIKEIRSIKNHLTNLSEMLIETVQEGASIGFLPPLAKEGADAYWVSAINEDVQLLAAFLGEEIAGTVQIHYCSKPNGMHRAEIAKLITHPQFRRMGIARKLMLAAEKMALDRDRSLLVLDTRKGDPSNLLYASLGFIQAGSIPQYALSEDGSYDATNIYYKMIDKT